MTENRRHNARKITSQEVMLSQGRSFKMCKLHDISLESALIEVGWAQLTHDTPVDITIDLPVTDGIRPFHLPGVVKRVTTHGTVIEFNDLEPQAFAALARYINLQNNADD
ncbi:MAG: PilZ domain-containing protein [Gammaproteobacteria bacterium]|nr:PilZ domain-containing protein [Gammaproteobacteria bacterium]